MRPRLPLLGLSLLALVGCPHAPTTPVTPPASPPEPPERAALKGPVATLSVKSEELLRAQDELVWKHWIEGTPADLATTYAGSDAWLTPESVAEVARLRALTPEGPDQLALTHLHAFLAGEWMARQVSELSDGVASLEQSLTFQVAGTDRAYRNLESLLASERSALRRREIYQGATPAVRKVAALVVQRSAKTGELLAQLGLEPAGWTTELREATPEHLGALAAALLAQTQEPWTSTLAGLAQRELQLPPDKIGRQDLPRLVRLPPLEAGFPKEEIVNRARAALRPMQLDPAALKTVTFDATSGMRKNPRGLVLGVVVPTDVRISLKPVGGARDQRSALHEFGHGVHDAFTEEKRFELAKLGNRTTAEVWAALLEGLTTDPAWLAQAGLAPDAARGWIQAVAVQHLFVVRRAAGKVLYNLERSRPGADDVAVYRSMMKQTYGMPVTADDEARAPLDVEETLASADYLRAWLLAEQLRAQLVSRYGASWWQSVEAGNWLRQMVAPGNLLTADGLASRMGEKEIRPEPFVARITAMLAGGAPPGIAPDAGVRPDAGVPEPAAPPVDAGAPGGSTGKPDGGPGGGSF